MRISLQNKITIDSQPTQVDYDISMHINKRLENFNYGVIAPEDSVGISYLGYKPISTDSILNFVDLSEAVRENAYFFTQDRLGFSVFNGSVYTSEYNSIEGTDIFLPITSNLGTSRPAWYKHDLPVDTVSASLNRVTSEGAQMHVSPMSYVVSVSNLRVYTDLRNIYDATTGSYELYYVDSTSSAGKSERHLLQGNNVLHEATWEDIDPDTGLLREGSGAYIVNQYGTVFEFTFSNASKKAIRPKKIARINPSYPQGGGLDLNWMVRLTNGQFSVTDDAGTFLYKINEFDHQDFVPYNPYKFALLRDATVIASRVLKTAQKNIAYDTSAGFHLDMLVKSRDGVVKTALTSNETVLDDIDYDWELGEFDVDSDLGLISVRSNVSILPGDSVEISYYYEEDGYEFTDVELNPQRNPGTENYMYVIYLVPNVQGIFNSLYYLKVNKANIIVEASQMAGSYNPGHGETFPNFTLYEADGTMNSSTAIGTEYRDYDGGAGPYWGNLYSKNVSTAVSLNGHQYLVLAEVSYVNPNSPDKISDIDARVLGGGVRPDSLLDTAAKHPYIQYNNTDLGGPNHGIPYSGYFSNVVRFPYTLLSQYGGDFTQEEIEERLYRHAAAGTYLILEPYGIIPRIESVNSGSAAEEIDITWIVEDHDYKYNVYVSREWRGPWTTGNEASTKHNVSLIDLGGETIGDVSSVYTIDGLEAGHVYKVAVTAVSTASGIESPPSIIYEVECKRDPFITAFVHPPNNVNAVAGVGEITITWT